MYILSLSEILISIFDYHHCQVWHQNYSFDSTEPIKNTNAKAKIPKKLGSKPYGVLVMFFDALKEEKNIKMAK